MYRNLHGFWYKNHVCKKFNVYNTLSISYGTSTWYQMTWGSVGLIVY